SGRRCCAGSDGLPRGLVQSAHETVSRPAAHSRAPRAGRHHVLAVNDPASASRSNSAGTSPAVGYRYSAPCRMPLSVASTSPSPRKYTTTSASSTPPSGVTFSSTKTLSTPASTPSNQNGSSAQPTPAWPPIDSPQVLRNTCHDRDTAANGPT